MPQFLLTFEEITAAVCGHWRDELPEPVASAYPGVQLATDSLTEWYEVSLDPWTILPLRAGDPEQARVELHIRCFVRPDSATGRVLQLGDYARAAFSNMDVPIIDRSVSDAAVIGWIRFDAGSLRDLSRSDRDQRRPPLRHVEWTWIGSVRA